VVTVIEIFGSELCTPSLPSFVRVSSSIASGFYGQRSKIDNEHDYDNEQDSQRLRGDAFQYEEKAVRGPRQRRAYYRCCIPALAGFVSQRSIAPDGSISMD
jgi:hypothetical protein